jgi:hypothetical protein
MGALANAALSFAMMSFGVPAGASTPSALARTLRA